METQFLRKEHTVKAFRIFMLMCAGGFLSFGLINHIAGADFYDPLWARIALSAICFTLLLLSLARRVLEKLFLPFLYTFFILVFLWILFLAYANDFRMYHTIQLLGGTLILNLGFQIPLHLALFSIFSSLTTLLVLALSGQQQVPVPIFIGMLLFGQIIAYVVVRLKYRSDSALLTAKHRAEQADRAKDLFLAKVSHEFRTPLNGIIGFTQLLQNDEADPERRKMHQMVRDSAELLFRLVNDLLDVSRTTAATMRIETAPFDPRELIDTMVAACRQQVRKEGITLEVTVSPQVPARVIGDRLRIGQIIMNLLSNALTHTDTGGVSLSVEMGSGAPGDSLIITVKDSGPGIPAEQQERIFERFVQLDTAKRHRQGLGLGLSIVRNLVTLMNGSITLESAPGKGSIFTVLLPIERDLATVLPRFAGTPRILIADDDPVNLTYLKKVLELMGLTCDAAQGGSELVDRATQERYDLIITDLQMPDVDGHEAIRRIRRQEREREASPTPALAISAFYKESVPENNDFAEHLLKPVRAEQLATILARHLPLDEISEK